MTHTPQSSSEQAADFTLSDACPACEGSLVIRTSLAGGRSFCTGCGWLARVQVQLRADSVELTFPTAGDA